MDYSLSDIAERLGFHISVVENYEEEWQAQQQEQEEDFITESFTFFLCRTFAECSFLMTAIEGGDAVGCLESYDEAYNNIENILRDD